MAFGPGALSPSVGSRPSWRRVQRHGYATEAAGAVVDARAAIGRNRLWATGRAWNGASFRVLEELTSHRSGRVTEDSDRGDLIWMARKF